MADLSNLLDEIDNASEDDVDMSSSSPMGDGDGEGSNGAERDDNVDDGDADGRIRAEIPAALAEAARRRPDTDGLLGDDQSEGGRARRSGGRRRGADDGYDDGDGYDEDDGDGDGPDPEYEHLKSLWSSELAAPELLPNDADSVALHVELLAGQEETVEELLKRSEIASRGGGGDGGAASSELASLAAQIYKMDLDRTRFMLVDMARTRTAKIENHALHNRTLVDRMSEEEVSYLRQYGELLEKHYRRTVLDHLPKEAWKKLDEPEMIDSPNLDDFVFCRALETVQIDASDGGEDGEENEEEDGGDLVQEFQAGASLIAMYGTVRDLVLEGKIELLI